MKDTTETLDDYETKIETALHNDWDVFLPNMLKKSEEETFKSLQSQLGGMK
jgi:hypothetical protein